MNGREDDLRWQRENDLQFCPQAKFVINMTSLYWTSVGKDIVDHVTSANHSGVDYSPNVHSHFPTMELKGDKKSGGFLDLLATKDFKNNTFMSTPDPKKDFILATREQCPLWLGFIGAGLTLLLLAVRATTELCDDKDSNNSCYTPKLERVFPRNKRYRLFGTLHLALFAIYANALYRWLTLPVLEVERRRDPSYSNQGKFVKYPEHLACETRINLGRGEDNEYIITWHWCNSILNLYAGVALLLYVNYCMGPIISINTGA